MKNYTRPQATDSNLQAIKKLYKNIDISSDVLQTYLVNVVREASDMSKREIMDKDGEVYKCLEYLFKNTPKGIDRGTLSAWFVEYTPIRPRFNPGNGHYKGIGFAKSPEWDLVSAIATPWWEVDPESTRQIKAPSVETQIMALMRAAAKLAAVSDTSVDEIASKIQDAAGDAIALIKNEMASEAVEKFVEAYTAQKAA